MNPTVSNISEDGDVYKFTLSDINVSRNCPKGIIHAVANLLILSKCKFIIGTVFSSYSDEACFFNMIMKLCIGNEKITKYHCYGYNELYSYNTLLPDFQICKKYYLQKDKH